MSSMRHATIIAAAAACAGALGAGAAAAAEPDLVIVAKDSLVVAGTCEPGDALATARLMLKNSGASAATPPPGLLDPRARSMVALYLPEHLDLLALGYDLAALGPGEAAAVELELGAGVAKSGRFATLADGGVAAGSPQEDAGAAAVVATADAAAASAPELDRDALLDLRELTAQELRSVQQALKALGYYNGRIDGVIGRGGRRAIERFQEDLGADQTGLLTIGQTLELDRKSGVYLSIGGAGFTDGAAPAPEPTLEIAPAGERSYRLTLFAAVDPYNVVAESNERNNLARFEIEVTCAD